MRVRASRRFAQHQVTRSRAELFAEALQQGVIQLADLDALEQLVTDPVRLHHPRIKRVRQTIRARDQLQVRHCAAELPQQWR